MTVVAEAALRNLCVVSKAPLCADTSGNELTSFSSQAGFVAIQKGAPKVTVLYTLGTESEPAAASESA